jgi:hypothetical protein
MNFVLRLLISRIVSIRKIKDFGFDHTERLMLTANGFSNPKPVYREGAYFLGGGGGGGAIGFAWFTSFCPALGTDKLKACPLLTGIVMWITRGNGCLLPMIQTSLFVIAMAYFIQFAEDALIISTISTSWAGIRILSTVSNLRSPSSINQQASYKTKCPTSG